MDVWNETVRRLTEAWARLGRFQRAVLLAAAALSFAGLLLLVSWPSTAGGEAAGTASDNQWVTLFRDLEAAEAGAIVEELQTGNVEHRLLDGGARIQVQREQVEALRLQFAAQGLPRSGTIGYEIFDRTNLGATDFVENLNFRRALEGELARTLSTIAEVQEARVHLNIPKPTLFTERERPPTASLVLKLHPGAQLERRTVQGMTQLVASAVDGLKASAVTILDQDGRVLHRGGEEAAWLSEERNDLRQQVESALRLKVTDLLDGVVGVGAHRVEVHTELDFEQIEKTIEDFDPASRVVRSEQREEETRTGSPADGDVVRETMTANYEIDRTVTKLVTHPGANRRRVSVSVVLDGRMVEDAAGEQRWEARSPDEIAQITSLVRNAVGARVGTDDEVFVTSMRFDVVSPFADAQVAVSPLDRWLPWIRWILAGILGLSILVLLRGLVRLMVEATRPPAPSYAHLRVPTQAEIEEEAKPEASRMQLLLHRVEQMAGGQPDGAAQLLRTWLLEGAEKSARPTKGGR